MVFLEGEKRPASYDQFKIWLWINTYKYHFLGDEHPFTSYFDVHQGYKVLTHCHIWTGHNDQPVESGDFGIAAVV